MGKSFLNSDKVHQVRLESDLLGELEVPLEAYYGVQPLR